MPSPSDDLAHRRARTELASIATGESADPLTAAHLHECATCRAELDQLRSVTSLARESGRIPIDTGGPPARVWSQIIATVDAPPDSQADGHDDAAASPPRTGTAVSYRSRPRPLRVAVLASIAVIALVAAGVLGWAIGDDGSDSPVARASARLSAQPGTAASVSGRATMYAGSGEPSMTVRTSGLPAPTGFYEVWLFAPSSGKMVAIGTLGRAGRGSFTLPVGVDVDAYDVVDVSAQRYDGDPTHQRSVLRGPLRG